MKITDFKYAYCETEVDDRPGFYYVSVVDGPQFGVLAGPYKTHPEALAMVETARDKAEEVNARAAFYSFGTVRLEKSIGPGVLNDLLGVTP